MRLTAEKSLEIITRNNIHPVYDSCNFDEYHVDLDSLLIDFMQWHKSQLPSEEEIEEILIIAANEWAWLVSGSKDGKNEYPDLNKMKAKAIARRLKDES